MVGFVAQSSAISCGVEISTGKVQTSCSGAASFECKHVKVTTSSLHFEIHEYSSAVGNEAPTNEAFKLKWTEVRL